MDHLAACEALEDEVGRFADILRNVPMQAPVPSCPDWTITDLVFHLGTIHRWVEHLVRVRASARMPSSEMGLSAGPADDAWIREGGNVLASTLRSTDPATPMWTWGADHHVAFWSRRQLHETLVHRVDLEIAVGADSRVDPTIAADAIEEFLTNLAPAATFSPNVRLLRGNGERLAVRATDTDAAWTILLTPAGFSVSAGCNGSVPAAVSLSGPALPLLLVLYRRQPLSTETITIEGDRQVADLWLANSSLE